MLSRRISLSKLLTGSSGSAPSDSSSTGAITTANSGAEDPQKECAIKVVIRARPLSDRELLAKTPVIINVTRTSIQVINPVVFLDPTYLEAISSPTKRVTQRDLPVTLSTQGVSAAIAAGECRTFHFDRCFGVDNAAANETEPFASTYDIDFTTQRPNQELIFDEIGRDMIESAFQGFNCTVLAYGQTGSGKTHTMVGEKTHKGKGLIPRVCEALFTAIDARRTKESSESSEAESETSARTDSDSSLTNGETATRNTHHGVSHTLYSATVSYCEIYKEKVNDLLEASSGTSSLGDSTLGKSRSPPLSPSWNGSEDSAFGGSGAGSASGSTSTRRALRVREHPTTGPFVEGLSSRPVASYADIAEEMLAGEKLRTVASTLMNPVSSRSHAVFTITFTQTTFDPATQATLEKTSKISMIDLAGSERANASGTSGDRLKEGAMINKSLTTLGRVISALSKQGGERVPYRDSTLTWLLKESLGGNAKTTMIAMVSPSSDNYDETMSTLRYAESAKRVINRAVINEDKNARIIRQLRQEIQELRVELELAQRSPRKRIASGAGVIAPAVATTAPAESSTSLAECDEFQSQLLQELEHLRSIQAQPPPIVTRLGTTHVHKTLPSLVVNVTKHFKPDSALMHTLNEGKTVFGSDEAFGAAQNRPLDTTAQESKLSIETLAEVKENTENASPPKRGWSPTFLRRRSSSTSAAAAANAAIAAAGGSSEPVKAGKTSPIKRQMSRRNSSTSDCMATTFHYLTSGKMGDILARHVQIVCTKLATVVDDESSESAVYSVEVEPLEASARVLLNGKCLPTIGDFSGSSGGTRVEMRHGDQLQLGDSHFFSLYVPQVAMNSDPSAIEPETQVTESLTELVDEANRICTKWNLRMEFALKRSGEGDENSNYSMGNADEDAEGKVVVKKHLDGHRYNLVEWGRPMLEAKVAFLRQFAASLEDSGSVVVVQEEKEPPSATRSEVSAAEQLHDRELSTASSQQKLSVHREPDAVSEVDEVNGFPSPELQAKSVSSSSSLEVSPPSIAGGHEPSPPESLSVSSCIRLVGQGRIFMPPLKSYSNGPMIAAVFDAAGHSIGRLFMHLQYTTTASEKSIERRPSLLAMARSASASFLAAALSPTSASSSASSAKPKAAQSTTMRIHLDKIVFDESQAMASDGVSLTLKKWSNLSSSGSSSSDSKKAKSGGGSSSPDQIGLATNFSTPKIPPLSNEKVTTTYAPLKIFQVSKVFETRLCFADLTARPSSTEKNGASSAGAGYGSAQDDFVAFEVWGYGKASLRPQNPIFGSAQGMEISSQASTTASASRKIDFYVSVDIDEREQDGIFRPVAVKADGALRIHASQPRRLNVRVTQADQQPFAFSTIAAVQIAPPFSTSCDSASLSASSGGTTKSTQWLLSPSSTRSQEPPIQSGGTNKGEALNSGSTETWRALDFRSASEQDASSRSLSASLKWDRDSRFPEKVDSEGSRSVFRIVIAVTAPWSRVPIVICKSVVTKISSAVVTTKLKLARELESSRTAWWARESFSREYRLGTWYTADVTIPSSDVVIEHGTIGDQNEDQITSAENSSYEAMMTQAVVNNYIKGLLRLEMVLELEHLRQQVLKMIPFSTTETVSRTSSRDNLDEHHQLTFDKVTEALSTLFENGDDQEQRFEIVQLSSSKSARQVLFLRKKTQRELLVGVKYGNVVDLSPSEGVTRTSDATEIQGERRDSSFSSSWRRELHVAHFVTEPSHLASGSGGEMSGFLMLSTAFHLDESAIAPLASSTSSGSNAMKADKPAKPVKANWERRWFVLKRPFLYAYKTFALKEEVGVLDISKCQLLTSSSLSSATGGATGNGWSHPSALSISHASASSNSIGSGSKANNNQQSPSTRHNVLVSTPFSFQLVCLVGAKCVVWTLQTSTALEMRAWLVAIDPLKIEAREAVVSSQSSSHETPVVTA